MARVPLATRNCFGATRFSVPGCLPFSIIFDMICEGGNFNFRDVNMNSIGSKIFQDVVKPQYPIEYFLYIIRKRQASYAEGSHECSNKPFNQWQHSSHMKAVLWQAEKIVCIAAKHESPDSNQTWSLFLQNLIMNFYHRFMDNPNKCADSDTSSMLQLFLTTVDSF